MREPLVRTDRRAPHFALRHIPDRLLQCVPPDAERRCSSHDPLRIEPGEQLHERCVLVADERIGGQADVVEVEQELLVRHDEIHLDGPPLEAGRVGGHREEHGLEPAGAASSVRPTTSTDCAWSTPEMNTLLPDSSQSAPSRRAVVVSLCEFDPASDSVIANAMIIEPSAMPGSQRSFCASVPKRVMIVPQIAGETTIISRVQPAAESSSSTSESSYMPPPPPPYSSGRFTPMKPSLPASCHSSSRCCPARAFLSVYPWPYRAPSSATAARSARRSSSSTKLMARSSRH